MIVVVVVDETAVSGCVWSVGKSTCNTCSGSMLTSSDETTPTLSAARSVPDESSSRWASVSSDDVTEPVAILGETTGTELNRRPLLKTAKEKKIPTKREKKPRSR